MSKRLAKLYNLLVEEGHAPVSALNKDSLKESERLQTMHAVSIGPHGRGRRVKVLDSRLVISESKRIFPEGPLAALSHSKTRHANVSTTGDSKESSVHYPTLKFRINLNDSFTIDEEPIYKSQVSMDWGVVASIEFLESEISRIGVKGEMVMLENIESFLFSNEHFANSVCSLYYSGRVKRSWYSWIKSSVESVIFCPDYDPVGIDEYLTAKEELGDSVKLFVPQNIEELFSIYSKKGLYSDNLALITKIKQSPVLDDDARNILNMMIKFQSGVEQEIVFPKLVQS